MVSKVSILFNETSYEKSIIELFINMEYEYVYGPEIERDFRCPFYEGELESALSRININKPLNAIQGAINKLKNIENASLVQKNTVFMDYLQNGISINYYDGNEEK